MRGEGLSDDQHAVRADHRLGVREEGRRDAVDVGPGRHLVDPQVLGEQQVAERVDGVMPGVVA